MKKLLLLFIVLLAMPTIKANDSTLDEKDIKNVILSGSGHPKPHYADVSSPIAMYNTLTEELSVTLDAVHYSDYTITLVSDLIEVDYYPFSPLVCLPTASMGDVVTIYIESDDCGSWYGEIDKAEFGGPISN